MSRTMKAQLQKATENQAIVIKRPDIRKVFIPNASYHNFNRAKTFGTLTPVTEGRLDILDTGHMFRSFKEVIDKSHPGDYILVSGPSIACSIFCSLFSVRHNRLNLLLYTDLGKGGGKYRLRQIWFSPNDNCCDLPDEAGVIVE